MPTPCSPVIVPPTSMHSSRIAAPKRLRALRLVGDVGVEHDQRVQVAVAGVEDVGAARARTRFAELGDAREHLRQRAPRDRAVHAEVVGGDAPHRRKRRLAPRPEQQALASRSLRHPDRGRAGRGQHAPDLGHLGGDFLGRAVGLDQQDRLRVERVVGVDEGLDRAGRRLVHHLEAGRE